MTAPFLRELAVRPGAPLPDEHPFNLPIVQRGKLHLRFPKRITVISGENGSGKSTLLEAIAAQCGFNPSGGSRNHVYGDSRENSLAAVLRLSWKPRVTTGFFMRAESFFNFSGYIDELATQDARALEPYGGKSLHRQSHGESFLSLFQNRLRSRGVFILDEPEAALSPNRQLAFLRILHDLDAAGQAQVIMATHSPILMACPGAQFFYIADNAIREVAYHETEHFKTMKSFLADPDRYLKHLLE
jgi:predicted ATPase